MPVDRIHLQRETISTFGDTRAAYVASDALPKPIGEPQQGTARVTFFELRMNQVQLSAVVPSCRESLIELRFGGYQVPLSPP